MSKSTIPPKNNRIVQNNINNILNNMKQPVINTLLLGFEVSKVAEPL